MKKILLSAVVACTVAGLVRAADSTEFGAMAVTSTAKRVLLAIPWDKMQPGGGDVAISNLVLTANLQAGDELHVIKSDGLTFDCWKLTSGTGGLYWQAPENMVSESKGVEAGTAADAATVKKGASVILIRNRTENLDKPIYVLGQVATTDPTAQIMAGTPESPLYSMIAPPSTVPQSLNGGTHGATWSGTINQDDRIFLCYDNGYTPELKYDGGLWKIYKESAKIIGGKQVGWVRSWVEYTDTIPVGRGFWYYSKGGSPTVSWTDVPKKGTK